MRRPKTAPFVFVPFAVLAIAITPPGRADDTKAGLPAKDALLGTWILTSAKYNGKDFAFPEGFTTLKVVTPGRYVLVIYHKDGSVARASGGTYKIYGDTYQETPEFSTSEGFDTIRGKPQTFKWRLEGDKWHHGGTLSSGITVEEVWERAK
jgi:hypothetical protein